MTVLLYMGVALIAFGMAIRYYGAFLAREVQLDPDNPTPACQVNDGCDYVPTKTSVLFAHHFSAIAGAGPILGPTIAILYGVAPAWLWIVLGGIFLGAAHDFLALFVCMREGGKSVAEVAKRTLGKPGFALFIIFTTLMLVLVTAAFLSAVSMSLTSEWPLAKLGLSETNTILHTTQGPDGVIMGRIGGIASTSVVIITLFSPFLGWLIYKRNFPMKFAYPFAAIICVGSIIVGVQFPIMLSSMTWTIIITIYVFFAAMVPVWVILQPRDFINVQILYAGIIALVVSLLLAGFMNMPFSMPAENFAEGIKQQGAIWPMMFILIACGAISGFHSLVAGGTTTKQLSSERDARRIGYNAMLLESLLAVCVLLAIGVGLSFEDYKNIVYPAAETGAKSNPILAFSLSIGNLMCRTIHIPVDIGTIFGILLVEGFVITTLDAAVRLNRYLFEELWDMLFTTPPRFLKTTWFNAGLSVILMWVLSYTNAFNKIWPIFGAGNQLLAALGLIAITAWLMLKGRRYFFAFAPAIFMIVTTIASLILLLLKYIHTNNYLLAGTAIILLALSLGVVFLVILKIVLPARSNKRGSEA